MQCSNKVNASNFITYLIAFSGLMICFAWDQNFNMQTLIPVISIVCIWYIGISKKMPITNNFQISIFISLVNTVAIIINLFADNKIISTTSIIRLLYTFIILIYFYIIIDIKYNYNQVEILLFGNYISATLTAILIVKNWLNGAIGKISLISFFGSEIEENYTGALLAFNFVLGMFLLFYISQNILKIIFIIISQIIILLSICLTGSRAALIAVILGTSWTVLSYLFKSKSNILKKIIVILFVISVIIYVAVNAKKILPDFLYNRMFGNGLQGLDDNSNSERIELWKFALSNYIYHPLLGYGVGNFSYYVHNHFGRHSVVVAHNTYIDFLIDSGLIGFLLYMYLFYKNIGKIFYKKGKKIIPLFLVFFFTSFIVGGERTFFFWNELFVMTIMVNSEELLNKFYTEKAGKRK